MQLITQGCVSNSIKFFKPFFMNKYNLVEYTDSNKPCIFYGCYTDGDLDKIRNNNSLKIIVFGGTDTYYKKSESSEKRLQSLKKIPNTFFISQSKFISDDLKYFNINYKFLPIAPTVNLKSLPVKKGPNIYIYTNPKNELTYGSHLYDKLIKNFKDINFILACAHENTSNKKIKHYSKSQLHSIYKSCFLGIRLTQHDGISATVQEMGLLGIKTVHNGNSPSCINYTTYDSIVRIIERERKNIGQVDNETAKKTYNFLNINNDWLNTNFYKKPILTKPKIKQNILNNPVISNNSKISNNKRIFKLFGRIFIQGKCGNIDV